MLLYKFVDLRDALVTVLSVGQTHFYSFTRDLTPIIYYKSQVEFFIQLYCRAGFPLDFVFSYILQHILGFREPLTFSRFGEPYLALSERGSDQMGFRGTLGRNRTECPSVCQLLSPELDNTLLSPPVSQRAPRRHGRVGRQRPCIAL